MNTTLTAIKEKISAALAPSHLDVVDESHQHAGHAGSRPEGETHFRITVVSEQFRGLNRIKRHQAIYDILNVEMNNPIHALAIKACTPDEYEQ